MLQPLLPQNTWAEIFFVVGRHAAKIRYCRFNWMNIRYMYFLFFMLTYFWAMLLFIVSMIFILFFFV